VAVQERVAVLEGKVSEMSQAFEARVDRRFEAAQTQAQAFEERVDRRFEAMQTQTQARFDGVDRRLDTIDARLSRQFMWLVGLVITTQAAIMTALIAAFLQR
jgi:ABC-type phosphate transport system auxiliary subunit